MSDGRTMSCCRTFEQLMSYRQTHGKGAGGGCAGRARCGPAGWDELLLLSVRAGALVAGCREPKGIGGEQVFSAPHSMCNQPN